MTKTIRVATDVGGITDLACFETDLTTWQSTIRTVKSDTTPDFEQGVLEMFGRVASVRRPSISARWHDGRHQCADRATQSVSRIDTTRASAIRWRIACGNRPDFFNLHRKPVRSCHVTCAADCPDAMASRLSSAKRSTLGAFPAI